MPKEYRNFEVYIVYVDPNRCDGCRDCIHICPCGVFSFSIKAIPSYLGNCLGCRACEAICKSDAVIVTEI